MLNETRSGRMSAPEFLQGLIDTLTQRGRSVLGIKPPRHVGEDPDLELLGEALLSRRGEASGVAIAQSLLAAFERAKEPERLKFLSSLADRFGPD
ncbi:MAG: MCD, Malonyl-CoA decarboxylase MCD, partial [Bradyrhizobium sp.]